MDNLSLISLYGTDNVDEIIKKKETENQKKSFANMPAKSIAMSAAKCKKLCEDVGLKYLEGYEKRVLEHTITDETTDRSGDIMRANGADIVNYIKNPIIPFAHDTYNFPVGKSIRLWHDRTAKSWKSWGVYFDDRVDKTGRSDVAFKMIFNGCMPACSIGFKPLQSLRPASKEEREEIGLGEWGIEYQKWELLEYSPCVVGDNPNALRNSVQDSVRKGILNKKDCTVIKDIVPEDAYDEIMKMFEDVVAKDVEEKTVVEDKTGVSKDLEPKSESILTVKEEKILADIACCELDTDKETEDNRKVYEDDSEDLDKFREFFDCCCLNMQSINPKNPNAYRQEENYRSGFEETYAPHAVLRHCCKECKTDYSGDFYKEIKDGNIVLKPFPNEHACRLSSPSKYEDFRRGTRKSGGKTYSIIFGKVKGEDKWEEQAYRYKKTVWTEPEARKHCTDHDGKLFEPASDKSVSDKSELVVGEIAPNEEMIELTKAIKELNETIKLKVKSAENPDIKSCDQTEDNMDSCYDMFEKFDIN